MLKKMHKISILKYLAAFLIPTIFIILMNNELNNDSWFVLAEGRYLVENGIHYTDVLTMHDGLNVVVQNYGFAAVFYLVYSAFGATGLYVMMLVLNFVICILIYKICMLISKKNTALSLTIMVITDLMLAMSFVTTRAQMVSYITFLGLIYVLEIYIKTNKTKYLWWLPILALIEINFHASYWWLLFLVLAVYIIDSIKKPKLHLQGYRTKPLIIFGLIMLLVGLMNPYGIKMVTYVFTSYGASEITSMVSEMRSFNLKSLFTFILYMVLTIVSILYIFADRKNIRMRYVLMFLGFLGLGLDAMKGMSHFILVMFFPLALAYKDVKIKNVIKAKIGRDAIVFWTGIVTASIFAVLCVTEIPHIKNGPSDGLIQAVDAIEESSNRNKDIKVFVGYNNGGYVEFRGYKAYLDPRAEVFLKKNNGKENILKEYEDFIREDIELNEFLGKYNFDYLIADEWHEETLYQMNNDDYEIIYENNEEKIKVFRKTEKATSIR